MDEIAMHSRTHGSQIWSDVLRSRIYRHRGLVIGMFMMVVLLLVVVFRDTLAIKNPVDIDVSAALQPPTWAHPMGTDQLGRDVFSRVIHGTRISLSIGMLSVAVSTTVGTVIGLTAAYSGGVTDLILMRIIDIMLAFPGILLALGIVSILGPSLRNVMIAVGIAGIPTYARLVRGSVLVTRESLYVEAARAIGAPSRIIMVRHILPNVVSPIIVVATLGVGAAILYASALSFIGLGSQPPTPEWGRMLSDGRTYLQNAWWISAFPGLGIMMVVFAMNLLGDGLRDMLDPRMGD